MSWSRVADIPTPRSEVASAVYKNAIWVIGGFGGPNIVERYIPTEDRWERMPDLPIGVDHPMAAAVDFGQSAGVYVFGGNSGGQASPRSFHLAPGAQTWREISPMPAARSAGVAVDMGDDSFGHEAPPPRIRIYVVGGQANGRLEPSTLEYDPGTDRWAERAAIPTPRDHLAGDRFQGRVCAVGGRTLSMSRNLAAFECYDRVRDTWERLPAAPTARGGVGAAARIKKLFFIGGEQPSGTFGQVEIYDSDTRTWTRGPDLQTSRHGLAVAAFGNAIYALSGGPTPGGSQTAISEVLRLPDE